MNEEKEIKSETNDISDSSVKIEKKEVTIKCDSDSECSKRCRTRDEKRTR